jgi:hypothetical protein
MQVEGKRSTLDERSQPQNQPSDCQLAMAYGVGIIFIHMEDLTDIRNRAKSQ